MTHTNFVDSFIEAGYTPNITNFNTKNNWFGVSTYHPDVVLIKGDNRLILSLNGRVPRNDQPLLDKLMPLFQSMSVKYICIKVGDNTIYETWTGEIPPPDIISSVL